jgi:DNA uptake protein ComE-like DNA-binding protein
MRQRLQEALFIVLTLVLLSPSLGSAQACVDINTASAAQFDRIIHIGPERARQIITPRRQRRFASVDELVRVRGIAAARLRDIKAQGLPCP